MRRHIILRFAVVALGLVGIAAFGIIFYGMASRTGENQQDVLASLVSRTLSTRRLRSISAPSMASCPLTPRSATSPSPTRMESG
jgi:hypothetical protein